MKTDTYSLEQLRMFVTVVETGSFSACARKLNKAQSAVSQGIANLEIDFAAVLFDRRTKKPTLTNRGKQLLSYAQAVLFQVRELQSAVAAMDRKEESEITLVLDEALYLPRLMQLLSEFTQAFPMTVLNLREANSVEIVGKVLAGDADLGLMFCDTAFPLDVDLCYLGNVNFVAAVNSDHALADYEVVTVADLVSHRQILRWNNENKSQIELPVLSAQLWRGETFDTILRLVKHGLGWGYLPKHMLKDAQEKGEIKILPVNFDHKPWNAPIDRVLQKKKVKGPALDWLVDRSLTLCEE